MCSGHFAGIHAAATVSRQSKSRSTRNPVTPKFNRFHRTRRALRPIDANDIANFPYNTPMKSIEARGTRTPVRAINSGHNPESGEARGGSHPDEDQCAVSAVRQRIAVLLAQPLWTTHVWITALIKSPQRIDVAGQANAHAFADGPSVLCRGR